MQYRLLHSSTTYQHTRQLKETTMNMIQHIDYRHRVYKNDELIRRIGKLVELGLTTDNILFCLELDYPKLTLEELTTYIQSL
jgi:hypothetical protein